MKIFLIVNSFSISVLSSLYLQKIYRDYLNSEKLLNDSKITLQMEIKIEDEQLGLTSCIVTVISSLGVQIFFISYSDVYCESNPAYL